MLPRTAALIGVGLGCATRFMPGTAALDALEYHCVVEAGIPKTPEAGLF